MAKNTGTLGKYDQRSLWKLICIVIPFDILFKKEAPILSDFNRKRQGILASGICIPEPLPVHTGIKGTTGASTH